MATWSPGGWGESCFFPGWRHACLRIFCSPLGSSFSPHASSLYLFILKELCGQCPTPAGTRQWERTSQPSLHPGLQGVISFLSHPQRQGKEASTPAGNKERHLPRSHTNTPLRSCSWVEGSLWWPLHLSACPLQISYPQSPQSVRGVPLSFTLILSHLLRSRQAVLGLGLRNPCWTGSHPPGRLYSKTSPGPPSWKRNPLSCHAPWLKMPTSGAPPPRHRVTQKKEERLLAKTLLGCFFLKKCPLIPPVPSWPFILSLTLVGLHQGSAN